VPGVVKLVDASLEVEVTPVPKSQKYPVIGPVEVFVKCTTNGEQPDVKSAVKLEVICPFTEKEMIEKKIKREVLKVKLVMRKYFK
jgi:hypothetical protein